MQKNFSQFRARRFFGQSEPGSGSDFDQGQVMPVLTLEDPVINQHGKQLVSSLLDVQEQRMRIDPETPPPMMDDARPAMLPPLQATANLPMLRPQSLPAVTDLMVDQKGSKPTKTRPSKRGRRQRAVVISWVLVIALLIAAVTGVVWQLMHNSPPDVTLYQVGGQSSAPYIGGSGTVQAKQQLDLSYPSTERALEVLVRPGDSVKANQQLIKLDPALLSDQIRQALNDQNSAQSDLQNATANGTSYQIYRAQQAYDAAHQRYQDLLSADSSSTLREGVLIAPFDGVVTAVNINSGSPIAPDTTLLTLQDESSMLVRVRIPLVDLGQVKMDQVAQVTPAEQTDQVLTGHVRAIIPQVDPQTQTFEVRVEVPNPNRQLLPGMSAFVRLLGTNRAFSVPRLAVLNPDRESQVFVVRDQRVFLRQVHIVGRTVDTLFIDSGLNWGDAIVLVGLDRLQDGQKIHITHVES